MTATDDVANITDPDPDPTKVLDNFNWAATATDPKTKNDYLDSCPNRDPFITWQGRQWWINYWWNTQSGTWQGSGYRSNFDPKQFFKLDDAKDELTLRTFGDKADECITAEIVLADLLGYGDYVLTVQGNNRPFAQFDSNVCFGAFTYQFGISRDEMNSHREIDMVETLSYNSQFRAPPESNAQFTLQPANDSIIKRFTIPKGCSVITLWLRRPEPGGIADTVLSIFDGSYSLEQLQTGDPTVPRAFYYWIPSQTGANQYLPYHTPESRERLHINLYLTSTQQPQRNPGEPPPSGEHSVTLTRFEFAQSRVWQDSVPINNTETFPGTTPSYLSFVDANWFYLFFRGPDNKLMWCTKEFGLEWSLGEPLNESDPELVTAVSPAAAAWPVRGPEPSLLYVFFVSPKHPGNQIWFTVFDGANWSPGKQIPTQDSTPTSPAAIYFNDKLYLFFKANDPSNRIIFTTFDGENWAKSQYINDVKDHTSAAPAVVYFNGGLYVFFKADDPSNKLLMCKPSPDGRWLPCQVVNDRLGPITTLNAPATMVLDDKLCVFYTTRSTDPMKYCVGTPDQTTWTSQYLNSVDHPNSTPVGQGTNAPGDAYIWFVPAAGPSEIRVSVGQPG